MISAAREIVVEYTDPPPIEIDPNDIDNKLRLIQEGKRRDSIITGASCHLIDRSL